MPISADLDGVVSASAYDDGRSGPLIPSGLGPEDRYWEMVIGDVSQALEVLRPVWDRSAGSDGFVSIGLPPGLADDLEGTVTSARALHHQIGRPNLLVGVPATAAGVGAVRQLTAAGFSTNVSMIFSLERYQRVIDAYLDGLDTHPGDLSGVHSVASFFLDRFAARVATILSDRDGREVSDLRGQAAGVFAGAVYRIFAARSDDARWAALANRGASLQRPVWVAAPVFSDTTGQLQTGHLVVPDTVWALPEGAVSAFEQHGVSVTLRGDTAGVTQALLNRLAAVGVGAEHLGADLQNSVLLDRARSYYMALAALA